MNIARNICGKIHILLLIPSHSTLQLQGNQNHRKYYKKISKRAEDIRIFKNILSFLKHFSSRSDTRHATIFQHSKLVLSLKNDNASSNQINFEKSSNDQQFIWKRFERFSRVKFNGICNVQCVCGDWESSEFFVTSFTLYRIVWKRNEKGECQFLCIKNNIW